MSWWRDLFGRSQPETKGTALEDLLRQSVGPVPSGVPVSRQSALAVPVVFACLRVIAEGVAQVPWRLYRRTADGGREPATDHPLWDVVTLVANPFQTSFEFRETLLLQTALMGNGYTLLTRAANGDILELLPLSPELVTVRQGSNFEVIYQIRYPNGGLVDVPSTDLWHFKGPSWNGWEALSLLNLARNAIGLSIAAERFGSQFFGNGARPSGIISPENGQTFSAEQATSARDSWMAAMGGAGQLGIAFLNGLKYQAISTVPEEAQFNETRAAQVVEICRAFRVNPVMVMQHDKAATYASSEQMFLSHLVHTLGPWFARFMQSADKALLTPAERRDGLHFHLDDRGLMRGSAKDRADYHGLALQNGWATVNEVRAIEGMEPFEGDEFNQPHQAAHLYGQTAGSPPA